MRRTAAALSLMILVTGAVLAADTLVLRDGRRIPGHMVGADSRDVDFEERSGFGRRMIRVPRRDIARIEFDDADRSFGRDEGREDLAGGIPRGMNERQVNVTAREAWTDTGIDVRAGRQIYFQTRGETRWGPNRRDAAAGERNSPFNPARPLPDRPAAALIGRIGDDIFFIGADPGPFRVRSTGRLHLGINDDVLSDNSGMLRVTVSY